MRSIWRSSNLVWVKNDIGRGRIVTLVISLSLMSALVACSSQQQSSQPASLSGPPQTTQSAPTQTAQSVPSGGLLTDVDFKSKSPDQLASYIFEHHGCKNCHTLGTGGKMGFTDRGKQVSKNFEGCVRLLTAMNVIAQVEEKNRTPEDKQRAARFEEYGCSTCHQITPGRLGLTDYGRKLASLHLACTDVERIVASNRQQ